MNGRSFFESSRKIPGCLVVRERFMAFPPRICDTDTGPYTEGKAPAPAVQGRLLVLVTLGIILVALNLRPAVTALPPIYGFIQASFPVSLEAQRILGMLPTLSFACMGLLTPWISRRTGLLRGLLLGMLLLALGCFGRAYLAQSALVLGLFSLPAFIGIGIGNVLLPPIIKDYFPGRIGGMTALYSFIDTLGAAAPSLCGAMLAELGGWHLSLGIWFALAIVGLLPWLALLPYGRHEWARIDHSRQYRAWKWPTAWAVTGVFAGGVASLYAFITWLPVILVQTGGVAPARAGEMLGILSLMGLIHNAIAPKLMVSWRHNVVVILFGALCILVGALGLAYRPELAWLWIIPAGLGAMNIPIGLTLVNMRSRSEDGSTALSGFMQGVGYLIGSLGPFISGYLYSRTGSWLAPLWFIALIGVAVALCGLIACRHGHIEDSNA